MSRLLALLVFCFCLLTGEVFAAVPSAGASCADNTNGATACYTNGCFVCTSGTWVVQPLLLGSTATSCGSTLTGALQYSASAFQYCNGSSWQGLSSSTSTSFNFTNQIGVATNTTISSNAVTLSGLSATSTATCGTNCTAIARNGAWGGTSVGNFVNGNTIAIRMTSATTNNTAKMASVTVGSILSGTWAVTTINTTPNPIAFQNQTGLATTQTVESNEVTLSGFSGTVTATCNSGCTDIAINGVWGGTTVAGFTSGDTIAIKQKSAATANTASTASVTVGTTTSSTWTVTTGTDSCPNVSTYGAVCADGTLYVGFVWDEFDNPKKMMTTRCDAGQTWNGSACTGTLVELTWDNGRWWDARAGYFSGYFGKMNTNGLATRADEYSPYYAAKYCYDLDIHGHTDWYLPASQEGALFLVNPTALNMAGDVYWTSTDNYWSEGWAVVINVGEDRIGENYSSALEYIRCVRTD